jgi:oxygen-dependent protoporphyrinogen oxidase
VPSAKRRLLKAATFLSSKWPHLTDPSHVLVRLSCGRAGASEIDDLDDDALMDRLQSDLFDATGLTEKPIDFHVERWPRSIPQLEVGHLDRIKAVRDDLQRYPGLALAGASYDGLGIASCIKSGERAATLCLATVPSEPSSTPQSPTPAT